MIHRHLHWLRIISHIQCPPPCAKIGDRVQRRDVSSDENNEWGHGYVTHLTPALKVTFLDEPYDEARWQAASGKNKAQYGTYTWEEVRRV